MHFWIHIESTKIVHEFKQKQTYKFIHDMLLGQNL
jgi:hypothetical protein